MLGISKNIVLEEQLGIRTCHDCQEPRPLSFYYKSDEVCHECYSKTRPIPGYEGLYTVSAYGRVFSLRSDKYLSPSKDMGGYLQVQLCKSGEQKPFKIQWLVLEAFVGPRPKGMWALHKNDIPSDNRLVNLYWGTPTENCEDRAKNNPNMVFQRGEGHSHSKLTNDEVLAIRASNEARITLANKYGISVGQISNIKSRRAWKHLLS